MSSLYFLFALYSIPGREKALEMSMGTVKKVPTKVCFLTPKGKERNNLEKTPYIVTALFHLNTTEETVVTQGPARQDQAWKWTLSRLQKRTTTPFWLGVVVLFSRLQKRTTTPNQKGECQRMQRKQQGFPPTKAK